MSLIGAILLYKALQQERSSGTSKKTTGSNRSFDDGYVPNPRTPESVLTSYSKSYSGYFNSDLGRVVLSLLSDNEEVQAVIETAIKNVEMLIDDDVKNAEAQLYAFCPQSEDFVKASENVKNMGFIVSTDSNIDWMGVLPNERSKTKFAYHIFEKETALNGIMLTQEMVLSGNNPYQERLEDFTNAHPNCKEKFEEAKIKVEKLSKRTLLLKMSESKRLELAKAQEELEKARKDYQTEMEYTKDSELYANLSAEQKKELLDYLQKREEFEAISKQTSKLSSDVAFYHGYVGPSPVEKKRREDYKNSIVAKAKGMLTEDERQQFDAFCEEVATTICSSTEKEFDKIIYSGKFDLEGTPGTNIFMGNLCKEIERIGLSKLSVQTKSNSNENEK